MLPRTYTHLHTHTHAYKPCASCTTYVPQTYYQKEKERKNKYCVTLTHTQDGPETKKFYHFVVPFSTLCGFQDDFRQCCTYVDLLMYSQTSFGIQLETECITINADNIDRAGTREKEERENGESRYTRRHPIFIKEKL